MLHFILIDILMDGFWLSINDISDIIMTEYLSVYDGPRIPDVMTIRNKLNEYVDLGLFDQKKEGRSSVYKLIEDTLIRGPVRTEQDMILGCLYFQNTLPVGGVIGHFILNQYLDDHKRGIFSFRHQFIAHALDEETVVTLFEAIRENRIVLLDMKTRGSDKGSIRIKVLPLTILNNIASGRRYLAIYRYKGRVYDTVRLDRIVTCQLLDVATDMEQHYTMLDYHLSKAWGGVSINKGQPIETLRMEIRVLEGKEDYIVERLRREGRHGTVTRVDQDVYEYTIRATDISEMMPWIRTFTGRIISLECSNRIVQKRFYDDLKTVLAMYEEVDHVI